MSLAWIRKNLGVPAWVGERVEVTNSETGEARIGIIVSGVRDSTSIRIQFKGKNPRTIVHHPVGPGIRYIGRQPSMEQW